MNTCDTCAPYKLHTTSHVLFLNPIIPGTLWLSSWTDHTWPRCGLALPCGVCIHQEALPACGFACGGRCFWKLPPCHVPIHQAKHLLPYLNFIIALMNFVCVISMMQGFSYYCLVATIDMIVCPSPWYVEWFQSSWFSPLLDSLIKNVFNALMYNSFCKHITRYNFIQPAVNNLARMSGTRYSCYHGRTR